MKKIAMMVVAALMSAGLFANSANLPVKAKKAHGTEKTVSKKQGDKKSKGHVAKHKELRKEKASKK